MLAAVVCVVSAGFANAEWKKQPSGTMAWLYSVHFADANTGWIGGSRGTLLTTVDGGATWTAAKRFTNDSIRDVYFADPLNGWVLCLRSVFDAQGSVAYLMVTKDGGKSWQKREPFSGRDRVVRLFFRSLKVGCAVGEAASLWCTKNGEDWQKYSLPVHYLMLDGRMLDQDTLILAGGGGTLLRSVSGGTDWERAVTPPEIKAKVNAVYFIDDESGWAVGAEGAILFTSTGGKSWNIQSAPVSHELTDVYFKNALEGFAVGSDGVVVGSQDGGKTWTSEDRATRHRLESLASSGRGLIAVGFGGTILMNEMQTTPGVTQGREK